MKIATINHKDAKEGAFIGIQMLAIALIASWPSSLQSTVGALVPLLQDSSYAIAFWKETIPDSDMVRQITKDIDDMSGQWAKLHTDIEKSMGKLKTKRYHRTDFDSIFNVRYLPDNEYTPYLQQIFDATASEDLDELWDSNEWENDVNQPKSVEDEPMMDAWTGFNDNPAVMERRYHLEWVNKHIGYGVFASVPIEANTILDLYSGDVNQLGETSYQWVHPNLKATGEYVAIDARISGNLMRFVNDDPNYKNTIYLKVKNRGSYYVLYKTLNEPVMKGVQLSVSYGDAYWESVKDSSDEHHREQNEFLA